MTNHIQDRIFADNFFIFIQKGTSICRIFLVYTRDTLVKSSLDKLVEQIFKIKSFKSYINLPTDINRFQLW